MTIDDLYDEFERRLRGYAMRLQRDTDMADDLVQETFIRALGHLSLLERLNRHQRRSWLFRVLKNVFLDNWRAHQRRQVLVEKLGSETEFAWTTSTNMFSMDILDLVPERDRELLEMRYVHGMTSREISEDIGIPAATVRSRLHLAIKRLRSRKSELI